MIAATLMVKISAETSAFNTALQRAQQAVRGSKQQMEQAATAVTHQQTRIRTLTENFRLGTLSEQQWSAAMRTAIADARQLAATSELTAKSHARLSQTIGQAERQLRSAGMAARRGVDGLEGMAVAFNGMALAATQGVAGVAAATSGFQQLAISMKAVTAVGVIGAIGAIATVVMTLVSALKQTEKAAQDAGKALEGMSTGRLRGLLQANLATAAAIRGGLATGNVSTVGSLVNETAGQLGVLGTGPLGAARRLVTRQETLAGLTVAQLNVQESLLRGALTVAESRRQVETRTTGELTQQATLLERMLLAQRNMADAAGERGRLVQSVFGGRQLQPLPLSDMEQGQLDFASKVASQAATGFKPATDALKNFRNQVFDISSSIVDGLVSIAGSVAGGFKAIGSAILGVVGGFMVALGKAIIATAIGIKTLRNIVAANPALSIAAGIALVAAGTALSASANRSAQATFGGGGGGGAISSGGGSSAAAASTGGGNVQTVYLIGRRGDSYTWEEVDRLAQLLGDGQARRVFPEWRDG